jgi:hypothetical protein
MKYFRILIVSILICIPSFSYAATLTFGGSATYTEGDRISVPVLLSTETGESANAVSASILYSSDFLTLVSISKSGSIITIWAEEPSYTQSNAQFEGVILNPGWSGTQGTVVTLTFIAKKTGNARISFISSSVLANDGKGTEIRKSAFEKNITIGAIKTPQTEIIVTPPAVTPSRVPNKVTPVVELEDEITQTQNMPQVTPAASSVPTIPYIVWVLAVVGILLVTLVVKDLFYRLMATTKKIKKR